MKLHEALEYCIEHKFYEPFNGCKYMCHALADAGMPEHVAAVQAKVDSFGTGWRALASVLHSQGVFEYATGIHYNDKNAAKACMEFYEDWIIELTVADQMPKS